MCGGDDSAKKASKEAKRREAERQANIKAGYDQIQNIFGGFDDSFYDSRANAYSEYALPQLDQQYEEAMKQLTYALSRNNRLDSSTSAEQFAKLQSDYDMQRTSIADRGMSYANDARSAVERSRGDLVSLNANLANPATIANEAQNRLTGLQAMPSFEPLAGLFSNIGGGLGTQADLERRGQARYNTGLFTPAPTGGGQNSSRTV